MIKKALVLIGCSLLLGACSSMLPPTETTQKLDVNMLSTLDKGVQSQDQGKTAQPGQLPNTVNDYLAPKIGLSLAKKKSPDEKRFDLSVKDMPARTFFMGLVKGTPFSMIVSPKVEGTITLNLKRVTIDQVMNIVRDVYGYEYQRTDYGFKVMPNVLETRIFSVNYLDVKRSGHSSTTVSGGGLTDSDSSTSATEALLGGDSGSSGSSGSAASQVTTSSEMDFWANLRATLTAIVGPGEGRTVVVNPQTGVVIVRAYPKQLRVVEDYLDTAQSALVRQVILEAKILEVELSHQYRAGINWSLLGFNSGPGTSSLSDGSIGIQSLGGVTAFDSAAMSLHVTSGGFDAIVKALSAQGQVHVLSSPRVATLNNQPAVIKVGTDQFFVTNISNLSTATTTGTDVTQDVDLEPFFSGIALNVTPQVSKSGDITLHIHPIISKVTEEDKTIKINDADSLVLPLATSSVRETDSVVHAHSNQIVILGGLMQNEVVKEDSGIPGLKDLPGVGHLFKQTSYENVKTELVILLKPVVVNKESNKKELVAAKQRFRKVFDEIHLSGRPDENS